MIKMNPDLLCNLPKEVNLQTISVIELQQNSIELNNLSTKKPLTHRIPAFGLLSAFLSVFCWSLVTVIVKLLSDVHSIQILVIRAIFQMSFYGRSIVKNKYPVFGKKGNRLALTVRAISGTIAMTSVFMAYRLIPLSDSSILQSFSPIFVPLFAYFILRESIRLIHLITGVLTVIGATIISKPEFLFGAENGVVHEHRLEGTVLSIVGAFFSAIAIIFIRKLKTTPTPVVIFWFATLLFITGSAILFVIKQFTVPTGLRTWSLLVIVGILGIGDQHFLTIALHYENAGPVSVTRTFNIVLSFIWEVFILSGTIELTSIMGAIIVTICVLVLALDKWRQEQPESFKKLFSSQTYSKEAGLFILY